MKSNSPETKSIGVFMNSFEYSVQKFCFEKGHNFVSGGGLGRVVSFKKRSEDNKSSWLVFYFF